MKVLTVKLHSSEYICSVVFCIYKISQFFMETIKCVVQDFSAGQETIKLQLIFPETYNYGYLLQELFSNIHIYIWKYICIYTFCYKPFFIHLQCVISYNVKFISYFWGSRLVFLDNDVILKGSQIWMLMGKYIFNIFSYSVFTLSRIFWRHLMHPSLFTLDIKIHFHPVTPSLGYHWNWTMWITTHLCNFQALKKISNLWIQKINEKSEFLGVFSSK